MTLIVFFKDKPPQVYGEVKEITEGFNSGELRIEFDNHLIYTELFEVVKVEAFFGY